LLPLNRIQRLKVGLTVNKTGKKWPSPFYGTIWGFAWNSTELQNACWDTGIFGQD